MSASRNLPRFRAKFNPDPAVEPRIGFFDRMTPSLRFGLRQLFVPRMAIRRFLDADEFARGLSPLDPAISAFRADKLPIDETRSLVKGGRSFALESAPRG